MAIDSGFNLCPVCRYMMPFGFWICADCNKSESGGD